jgi:hypothetical protein
MHSRNRAVRRTRDYRVAASRSESTDLVCEATGCTIDVGREIPPVGNRKKRFAYNATWRS